MKIRKLTLALVAAAVGSGTYAAVASNQWLEARELAAAREYANLYQKREYLVAKNPLPAGSQISPDDITVRELVSDGVHQDALTRIDAPLLLGKTVKHDLSPDAPVLKSQISFTEDKSLLNSIADEERLVTIGVDALSSINGLLKPDDRVDVLFTDMAQMDDKTVTLLTDMRVVATGHQLTRNQPDLPSAFNTVTLACRPIACQRLTHARSRGELSLILSRTESQSGQYPAQTTSDDLLGIERNQPKKVRTKPVRSVVVYGGGVKMN